MVDLVANYFRKDNLTGQTLNYCGKSEDQRAFEGEKRRKRALSLFVD